ncbi:NUDIX hydrolase [Actinocatenispora comari]|uniref:NUDIX hydrolase n=1 Tax=Actinocatenispora comari TaxID=2807577 RepID=UPI001A928131|nr:NUDIX domain-containing protein [Actinocatenispora comari]
MAHHATSDPSGAEHEVLAAVLSVRAGSLRVLLWQRARDPQSGRWSLPGGRLGPDEDVDTSIRRHLAQKVDVARLAHLEQIAVFSDPARVPGPVADPAQQHRRRVVATAFLGLVPTDRDPALPADTAWQPADTLPPLAFDHAAIADRARGRLRAKLSYTNLGFALAPPEFTISQLREIYAAALGYRVSATNMQRVLTRRGVLAPTGAAAPPGRSGGRPAALYRFAERTLRVTDPFAVLGPPRRR